MELVKDLPEMTIDVELKEYPNNGNEEISYSVCDRVLKIIDEYGYTERCVINTWSGTKIIILDIIEKSILFGYL